MAIIRGKDSIANMYVSMPYTQKQQPAPPKHRKSKTIILVLLFFSALLVFLYIQSPLSKIRSFEVAGANSLKPEQIIADSGLSIGMSLWKVRAGQVEQAIQGKNPLVGKVDLYVNYWSGKVTIALTEKKAVGLFLAQGKFYRLFADGTVLQDTPANFPDVPVLSSAKGVSLGNGQKIQSAAFLQVANQLAAVNDNLLKQVSEIREADGRSWYKWIIYMKNKDEIHTDEVNIEQVLQNYTQFREQLNGGGKPPGVINFYQGKGWYDAYR